MNVKDWHPVQLGLFWLLLALFGFPVWLGLAIVGDFLANRYPPQPWFELIPIGLAFVVVFLVVGLGALVTSRWLDARPRKTTE
jgi:hypothetical protein